MSEFTGQGFVPVGKQLGSDFAESIYRAARQQGCDEEQATRRVYGHGYLQGRGHDLVDLATPGREYHAAKAQGLTHREALDEVLLAGYQASPKGMDEAARRFADELAGQ